MKKILRFFWHRKKLSIGLLVIIGLILFFLLPKNSSNIETQKIEKQNIVQSVTTSGKIESETTVKLSFLAPGKLVYIGAKKGDFVKSGQTIASLDTRSVQKNLENNLRDYSKQRNTFDDTLENYQNRTPAQAINDDMKRILQNNQYDLEKAIISVELQSLAKEQSYLVSPIDGVITDSGAEVPGINIAVTNSYQIADPDHVKFVIEVDESDIGKVRMGMPVKVTLESFPDDPINLTVSNIDFTSHTSSNGGNVFDVEAQIPDNAEYKYRIGMTGDAEIITSEKKNVLTVPLGSIVDDKFVYIRNGQYFEKRKVVLGVQNDTDKEAIVGVHAGDEVAIAPDEAAKIQKSNKKFIFF